MSDFETNAPNLISTWALPQTPGEAYSAPADPLVGLKGLVSKMRDGRGINGKGGEGKGIARFLNRKYSIGCALNVMISLSSIVAHCLSRFVIYP